MSKGTCSVLRCDRAAQTFDWCDMHYRRWVRDGHPGNADKKTPGAGVHDYPADDELVVLMQRCGNFNAVAREIGVRRESLRDYLARRPQLNEAMRAARKPRLTPEQRAENDRRCAREWARRYRAENPDEARRVRREHMNAYGPEYRHKWNHYNRLRRRAVATPDELSNAYALVLRGDPCSYCGGPMQHIDHIDPIALGGSGSWDNLTAACADCNHAKGARRLLDFMLCQLAK